MSFNELSKIIVLKIVLRVLFEKNVLPVIRYINVSVAPHCISNSLFFFCST